MSEPAEVRALPKTRLPVEQSSAPLARHPDDAWRLADPYPMGEAARRAFRGLIRAVCPPAPAPASPEIFDRVELYVRRFMRYMHPVAARGLWLAILLVDWAPRLLFLSWQRLQGLDRERAARILTKLVHSRFNVLRTVLVGVRGAILSAYFDQDEVHRALGYKPIPFLRDRLLLRRQLLRPSRVHTG
jgi:hypothetical protein